jgi:ParB/RepB/Spo0J family partition protein
MVECDEVDLGAEDGTVVLGRCSNAVAELELPLDEIGEAYGGYRLVDPRGEKQIRDSIKRYGQMSPVVLCHGGKGGYELVDGFKRLRAARQLSHLPTLRGRVLDVGARAAKAAVLCLNWATRAVCDVEEGWVVHALCREDGLTQEEAGRLLGRDRSWVSRRLSLVERLTDEVQSQLRVGLVSATVSRELARVPRGTQIRVVGVITREGLGSREVSAMLKLYTQASPEEREQILSAPREALARAGQAPGVIRDRRLSSEGNRLLSELGRMACLCTRVSSKMDTQELCRFGDEELAVLTPALSRAQRSGQQAAQALSKALAAPRRTG